LESESQPLIAAGSTRFLNTSALKKLFSSLRFSGKTPKCIQDQAITSLDIGNEISQSGKNLGKTYRLGFSLKDQHCPRKDF